MARLRIPQGASISQLMPQRARVPQARVPTEAIIKSLSYNPLAHGIQTAGNVLGQALGRRTQRKRQLGEEDRLLGLRQEEQERQRQVRLADEDRERLQAMADAETRRQRELVQFKEKSDITVAARPKKVTPAQKVNTQKIQLSPNESRLIYAQALDIDEREVTTRIEAGELDPSITLGAARLLAKRKNKTDLSELLDSQDFTKDAGTEEGESAIVGFFRRIFGGTAKAKTPGSNVTFVDSDGLSHTIRKDDLPAARQRDPGLKVTG